MRRPDWPERLSAVFVAARGRAFEYGVHDCGLFAADCVEALTGTDPAAVWRGRYATQAEFLALAGVRSLSGIARRIFAPVPVSLAWRGDLALAPLGAPVRGRPAPTLMVFDGALLRGPCGAIAVAGQAIRAWRVE
jgi:hypothetical protein